MVYDLTQKQLNSQSKARAGSVINNASLNSMDNLQRSDAVRVGFGDGRCGGKEGSGEEACHAFYSRCCCKSAVAVFLLTQFLTECVPPWSEQRGTIQMGIK